MNTCPDCKNDLVCHDQGECLRPTPETDAEELHEPYLVNELPFCVVRIDFARTLERQRNEALHKLEIAMAANSDVERIAKERNEALAEVARLQMELDASCNAEELRQAREENARMLEALEKSYQSLTWAVDNMVPPFRFEPFTQANATLNKVYQLLNPTA